MRAQGGGHGRRRGAEGTGRNLGRKDADVTGKNWSGDGDVAGRYLGRRDRDVTCRNLASRRRGHLGRRFIKKEKGSKR